MSEVLKRLVLISAVIAGYAVLSAILDLTTGFPYSAQRTFDITLLVTGLLMLYMFYNVWKEK